MKRVDHPQIELQIAPMIDVCFLLLFFYILTSKPVKPESDMSMSLPGTVAQDEALELPDEQRVTILESGQVVLNEQPMDAPNSTALPTLLTTLKRFKESTEANKTQPLLTVDAADLAPHQRIVDVLSVCAEAGIKGVTFATAATEEP